MTWNRDCAILGSLPLFPVAERFDKCGLASRGEEQFAAWQVALLGPGITARLAAIDFTAVSLWLACPFVRGRGVRHCEGLLGQALWLKTPILAAIFLPAGRYRAPWIGPRLRWRVVRLQKDSDHRRSGTPLFR
jgi:hypothetical protein